MSMKNAISKRKSERSYNGKELKIRDEKKLISYIENKENLLEIHGTRIQIYYMKSLGISGGKIGTYGVIKNAPGYLVTVCKNNPTFVKKTLK